MPKGPPYYPTRVGARWVHQFGDNEFETTVAKVEARKDGSKVVTVDGNQRVLATGDGLFVLEDKADQPARRILFTRPGVEWTTRQQLLAPDPGVGFPVTQEGKMTHTSHRPERVVTPAGTFNAIRVESVFVSAGWEQRSTRWYAPGVGLVKSDCNGEPCLVLKRFAPGKD
jgi:hypothetical protein